MGTHGTSTWIPRATSCWWKASYTGKNGKKHELLVKADGTETKEWQDHTRFSAAGVCFWAWRRGTRAIAVYTAPSWDVKVEIPG